MERIQKILEHEKFNDYIQRIRTLEQGRPYCLHPVEHSIDVARIAYILWLEYHLFQEKPSNDNTSIQMQAKEVKLQLYAASLLHDIGRFRQYLYGENHAESSAQLAVEILHDVDFDPSQQEVILDAIRNHNRMESPNLFTQLIQQADRLSRMCYRCKEQSRCYKISQMETRTGLIY